MQAAIADAGDDLLQERRIVVRHGHVVEEEQRLGAAAQHVVDAHGRQVDADGVVAAGELGDLEFRANAVGATHQHRVFVAAGEQPVGEIQLEQAGETAGQRHHARRERATHQRRQAAEAVSVELEIDAGGFVGDVGHIYFRVNCDFTARASLAARGGCGQEEEKSRRGDLYGEVCLTVWAGAAKLQPAGMDRIEVLRRTNDDCCYAS